MLAFSNSQKVGDVITKLKNHSVNLNAIENNLTVLFEADADEIDGILDTLSGLEMSLEENISILKYTTAKRLNEIIEFMKGQNVRKSTIKKELKSIVIDDGKLGIKVEDIFARRNSEDRKRQIRNVRRYMSLTGMFGQYYTREELEPFCAERNITIREFVEGVMCSNMYKDNGISPIYYERIMEGKRVYIGPTKPIDHDYLEEHAEEILELGKIAARKFLQRRKTPDFDELSGLAVEIIMTKCGNLVDNLQDNISAMRGSIVNRTARYLYSVVEQNKTISITQKFINNGEVTIKDNEYAHDVNGEHPYEPDTSLQEVVDYEKAEFSTDETDIMNYMIRLIEEGEADDLYEKIANNFGMEEDEVLEVIQSIRQKMIQKNIVRENRSGGYLFTKSGRKEEPDVDTDDFDL